MLLKLLEENKELVKELVEKIPPEVCSTKDSDGSTLFSLAIKQGYISLAEEILEKTSPAALTINEWIEIFEAEKIESDINPITDENSLANKFFEKMLPEALTVPLAKLEGKTFIEIVKENDFEGKEILLGKMEQKLAKLK